MPRRSYDHYCAIARALDHLGERWALLIIRELLAGPRRYSDLLVDLPGISTDVLATRLRELENDGLLTRRQEGVRTYRLTPAGAAAAPILEALADWGAQRAGQRGDRDAVREHWLGPPLARRLSRLPGLARPDSAGRGTVEFRVEGTVFHLLLAPDRVRHVDGPADAPGAVVTTSAETAMALAAGTLDIPAASDIGALTVTGDPGLVAALLGSAGPDDAGPRPDDAGPDDAGPGTAAAARPAAPIRV